MAAAVIIVFLFLWHLREDAEYCQHLCPLLVLFRCLPVGRSGLDGLEALGNEEPYLPLKSWVPCLAQESLFLIMHLEIPGGGVVVTLLGINIKGLSNGASLFPSFLKMTYFF